MEDVKELNIFPIKKSKRLLIYLADFFICLLASFLVYNTLVFPGIYYSGNYSSLSQNSKTAQSNISEILKGNNLLYSSSDDLTINDEIETTYDYFIVDFLKDPVVTEHDVFKTYYINNLSNESLYIQTFEDFGSSYFDLNDSEVSLKNAYKTLLSPLLNSRDGLSENGEAAYSEIRDKFFLVAYERLANTLKTNDISFNGKSYRENTLIIEKANQETDKLIYVSSFVSFSLAFVICFVLIPLINKNGQTISMMILKTERVDKNSLRILKKGRIVGIGLYYLLFMCAILIAVPSLTVRFEYLFNLLLLLWPSLVALLLSIFSFIYTLFNSDHQTAVDKITNVVYISTESLDEIYRARGY